MGNLNKIDELRIFLSSLTAYKGFHFYHISIKDQLTAVDIALEQKMDMDNAIQYSAALSPKAEAILSFDKHFNNLKIHRIELYQTT
jgi:predicted nucleic acid-binding protein